MRASLIFLTRRGARGTSRREQQVEADVLRIGRAAHSEAYLADPRVLLDHAAIHARPDGFWIEAQRQAGVTVNGVAAESQPIRPGDAIRLGPYQLVVESTEGDTLSLSIELLNPLGDDLARLRAATSNRLASLGFTKRQWAWAAALAVLVVGLVLPVAGYVASGIPAPRQFHAPAGISQALASLWLSGPSSEAHKSFIGDCGSCHQAAFRPSGNGPCLACHEKVAQHTDTEKHPAVDLAAGSCRTCHQEHKASGGLVLNHPSLCTDCHAKGERPATDFARNHPQFRPTLATGKGDEALVRVALDANPRDLSGLKFPHSKHLKDGGLRTPSGETVSLDCGSCHRPTERGQMFKPISFQADCQGCHMLAFDRAMPEARLPHAKPAVLAGFLSDAYSAAALRGDYKAADLPEIVRRIPGQPSFQPTPEKTQLIAWAKDKAQAALQGPFVRGQCGECHTVTGAEADAEFGVAPVYMPASLLPNARFNHAKHKPLDCGSCHAAKTSDSAEQVLLPRIESCRDCHGGAKAADKVASTCTSCHDFHRAQHPAVVKSPAFKPLQSASR